ncbi:MAG: FAD-dependent oxidoreductase, partial [Bryobacteraceae bacterium]
MGRDHTVNRRAFFTTAFLGLTAKADRLITGRIVDDSHLLGHKLRERAKFPSPKRVERIPVVIAGGGIAGLSAAWRLDKRGFRDFVLLEMEKQAGGNARWGENEITPFPWAAHYVPVPGKNSPLVRELFEELGVLRDGVWEEQHLCHSPQERLFLHGRWQEGLLPEVAATARDRQQYRRFEQRMAEFRASGEFRIPMASGARRALHLDRLSMAAWMKAGGFDSAYLNWYVDYACRDDYGTRARETSAWAGIHYFAAREQEEDGPLTWSEGNGWIVRQLLRKLGRYVRTGAMVYRIGRRGRGFRVLAGEVEYHCDRVLFATPTFLLPYVLEDAPPPAGAVEYSPWITANLTLDRPPAERGAPRAWDNVFYNSPSLGYVVATHQSLRTREDRSVWTWYRPLCDGPPAAGRRMLLARDWAYWKETILNDLAPAHPDIRSCVS